MHVWGGHSCPPLLTLNFVVPVSHYANCTEPQTQSQLKKRGRLALSEVEGSIRPTRTDDYTQQDKSLLCCAFQAGKYC